jgi:hypothetical protein
MAADKPLSMEQVVPGVTGTSIEMVIKTVCLCVLLARFVQTCQAAKPRMFHRWRPPLFFLHAKT